MAWPNFVVTREVTSGPSYTLEDGTPLKTRLTVTASRSLVWDATGIPFTSEEHQVTSALGVQASLLLPVTDQAGWRDDQNNLIDVTAPDTFTHTYRIVRELLDEKNRVVKGSRRDYLGVVVPTGTGAIDVDLMLPTETVEGAKIAIPDTWSQDIAEAAELVSDAAGLVSAAQAAAGQAATSAAEALEAVAPVASQVSAVAGDVTELETLTTTGRLGEAGLSATIAEGATTASRATTTADKVGRLTALRRFHRSLGRRTFDTVNVLVIGDSITEGGSVTQIDRRWVERLRDNLRQRFAVPGVAGGRGFLSPRWASASNPAPAPATFTGGTPTANDDFGWGKRAVALTTSQTITWTGVVGTSVDVLYARGTSSGTINVSVNGGAPVTASTSTGTTNDTGVLNVPLAAGSNTIVVSATVATIYPGGIIVYNGDETKGIRVIESGHWGWRSQNWSELSTTRRKYTMDRVERLVPDLVLYFTGINDHRNGVDPTVTKANTLAFIQAVRDRLATPLFFPENTGQASFVIGGYFESQGSYAYPWEAYATVFREIAAANTDVSFLDLREYLPAYNTDGYAWTVDGVHPSDETHGLIADAVTEFLMPR